MEGMTPQQAADILKRLKDEHGLKQYEIAERLGCTSKCLASWRRGNNIGRVLAERLGKLVATCDAERLCKLVARCDTETGGEKANADA